ncbi:hypothetical protein B0I35DRAFT_128043 [Stachybotrys elegans]|uniref:Uncharacterized protein n=1 Tax=Stachybotrys elegans TaxID=80388 RepID=A0A8K0SZA8_9HYPO|nr:hypothetical protein B0I35DRAFT_128043 [Stachybotrys elegans]
MYYVCCADGDGTPGKYIAWTLSCQALCMDWLGLHRNAWRYCPDGLMNAISPTPEEDAVGVLRLTLTSIRAHAITTSTLLGPWQRPPHIAPLSSEAIPTIKKTSSPMICCIGSTHPATCKDPSTGAGSVTPWAGELHASPLTTPPITAPMSFWGFYVTVICPSWDHQLPLATYPLQTRILYRHVGFNDRRPVSSQQTAVAHPLIQRRSISTTAHKVAPVALQAWQVSPRP